MSVAMKHSLVPLVLVIPTAGFAIGLGDIHVESALNEPLAARIEIVGATAEDLQDLRAAIASREIFQRYSAERPSFLASARFKVAQDPQGHPILQVTSSEPFTEPVVSLLVDLRWDKGELIREYPLLLDPADFGTRVELHARTPKAETRAAAPTGRAFETVNPGTVAANSATTAMVNSTAARSRATPRPPPRIAGRPDRGAPRRWSIASPPTTRCTGLRIALPSPAMNHWCSAP
jgi:pilus assembly protein FimV